MELHTLHQQLSTALAAELEAAIALRHELHRHPERSGNETWTSQRVAEELPCRMQPIACTGRFGRLGPAGPAVVLRAELDALPVTEATGAAFSSGNGLMHACGHDVHLAALTAVARAAHRVSLPVGLGLLLQPREETAPSGARDVVEEGLLQQQDVKAVVGAHLQPQLAEGTAAADAGVVNAGSDQFEVTINGTGGHGGYPHLTRDPVPALCQTIQLLLQSTRTSVDPMRPSVVTVGSLHAGNAANVIPDRATARGTIRTFDPRDAQRLHEAIRAAVESTAAAFGCQGTVSITRGEPPLANHPELADRIQRWLTLSGFDPSPGFRSCGADDFSFYSQAAPSQMIFIGTGPHTSGLHDPRFLPDDALVAAVARAMIAGYLGAVDAFGNPR